MARFSRRDFFKFTSAFFAFIPAIKGLSALDAPTEENELQPEVIQDPPPPLTDEDLIVEKYESGIAKSITPNQIVIENYKGQVTLHVSDQTDLWDGIKWVGDLGSDIGDEIVAWGIRNPNGSLTCEKLYTNIVNYIGEAVEIKHNKNGKDVVASFVHNDRYRGQQFISIDPSTFIDDGKTSRKPFREFSVLPDDRETIQVIGRGMKDGTTLAVVVYMSR